MKVFSIHSLGCKVNQYDGQLLREHFLAAGFVEQADIWHNNAADGVVEDVFVLNTCTVTEEADKECARILRKMKRVRPKAKIVITGCAVTAKDQALRKHDVADLVVGNEQKGQLLDLYAQAIGNGSGKNPPVPFRITGFQKHCRAFVKIQDGCNEFCSFCKIPFVRGRNRSRSAAEIRQEIIGLAANDYQEIVFTGVHAGNYTGGTETTAKSAMALADLVGEIHDIAGIRRLRFSSIEPMNFSRDLIAALSVFPKVCPHFHLPLQSGDDQVLRSMRRRYTVAQYRGMAQELREHFRDAEITTDIIVGFPGETAAQFENTLCLVEELQFLKVHVFPYSARPGTLASGFADQIPAQVIHQRAERLGKQAEERGRLRRQRYLDRVLEVLVEGKEERPGLYAGFTANYLKVFVPSDRHSLNQFRAVKILSLDQDGLLAETVQKEVTRSSLPIGY